MFETVSVKVHGSLNQLTLFQHPRLSKTCVYCPSNTVFLRLFYMFDMYYVFMTLVPQCILHTKITFNPNQAKNNFVELSCWQHATTTRCHLVYTLLLSEIASLGHAERVRFLPDTHRLCSAT